LAELLIGISDGNAIGKQRLSLELAGADGTAVPAKEIRQRVAPIAGSRAFVEWQDVKPLINYLEAQRRAIVDQVAARTRAEAVGPDVAIPGSRQLM
jgi:hypothetical protein